MRNPASKFREAGTAKPVHWIEMTVDTASRLADRLAPGWVVKFVLCPQRTPHHAEDFLSKLGLVDQTELLRWADSQEAKGELPRLIRRLILETGRGVVELGFPAGEGIASGGWDGTVRASEATAYIPEGFSLWEVSVDKGADRKANKDYAKRLATPDGSPTNGCTYIEVILRRWAKRLEWAKGKAADFRWRAVRAYGVDDLETWLELAPVTHAWLSELLGSHPHGLISAETWWTSWAGTTTPPFPAAAVLAGRDAAVDKLRAELAGPGHIVTVQGASRDDVLALVSALGLSDAQNGEGALLARTALIDKLEAWRRLRDHKAPLVLVPRTEEVIADHGESAHHLIVPVVGAGSADITLPPIDSQGAIEALKQAGLPERNAEETGRLARMSLLAARRRIASKPELHRPAWALTLSPRLVRRALLVGRWNENSPADVTITTSIFGTEYDSLRDELESLMSDHDPLLVRSGSSVGLVSPFDAWLFLCGSLRKVDLETFKTAALVVFGEIDPAFELPPEDRWKAAVHGKSPLYSRDLRCGLATTLALLGSHGGAIVAGSTLTGQEWASWTVREILEAANRDKSCRLWASLRNVLTLLAEAAPSRFLEAMRAGLNGESPLLQQMFMDNTGSSDMFSDSAHTHLLWALEICAWSPTDFGQVVDLLARLSEVDPGGRLMNRPIRCLCSIFRPWYPQTSASSERRLAALDGLRERHQAIAWELMLSMLPKHHSIIMPASEPLFRDWKPEEIVVSKRERRSLVEQVSSRLLEDVGLDPARWKLVITNFKTLPSQFQEHAFGQLATLSAAESLDNASRYQIWDSLRSEAARHREFADADWALPAAVVARFEETGQLFEPPNPTDRLAWLFDDRTPEIPAARRGTPEHQPALDQLRAKAAEEIAASLDWQQLHAFAIGRKQPWLFGRALAEAGVTKDERKIIRLLGSDNQSASQFASSYVYLRFLTVGWPWVEKHLRDKTLSPEKAGLLLLSTSDFPKSWEVAKASGEDIETAFWRRFQTIGLGSNFPYVETVAQKLLDAGRPGSALDLLALYSIEDGQTKRAELMAVGLEELLQQCAEDPEAPVLPQYDLMEIFSYIAQSELPMERVARLEWSYLPAFRHYSPPPTLSRYLASDPSFFVDVVSRAYPPHVSEALKDGATADPETEVGPELGDAQQAIAVNAYLLLSEWRIIPGKREDGTIAGEVLNQWVSEARRLLRAVHRLRVGDSHIGMVLASSLATDPDGSWPCVEVRDLLETIQSEEIENGLQNQIYENRGATSRGGLDGGEQELGIAAEHKGRAMQFSDRWPRTAAIFRRLAEDYEREARYFDETAERRRKGFEI